MSSISTAWWYWFPLTGINATIPNFLCQEHRSLGEGYLKKPFVVKEGYVELPTGLGIELRQKRGRDSINRSLI